MNPLRFAPILALAVSTALGPVIATAAPAKKPAAKKPAAKKKPAPKKPAPSKGDIALKAVRKCDADKNGTINGGEVTALRLAFRDPKNFLDLYDDNGSGALDDQEILKINAKLRELKKKK